jgi:DNA-binding transcriptional MerR regulator
MRYRIGEFAELSGVSVKTLRFYDQIGLLRPAAVDSRTRYRLYVPRQLQELASIRALQELGASLQDIRCVVGAETSLGERRRLLEKLKLNAEQSMAAARRSLAWIDGALGELEDFDRPVSVVVKTRPAVRVASVRAKVHRYEDIVEVERDLQRAVTTDAAGDFKGVLWHRCADSGSLEGEPFVELKRDVSRCGAYELKHLPSVTVASAYCESEEDAAEHAYDALRRWMHLHDYRLDGPKREIYLGRMLEIQFPLKSA